MVVETDCKFVNSSLLTSHYIILYLWTHKHYYEWEILKPIKSTFNLHVFKKKLPANIKYKTVFQSDSFQMPVRGNFSVFMCFKYLLLTKILH